MEPIKAVIFDWAGTLIDHGSLAPVAVFQEVFATEKINVTLGECRIPMGIAKREHINAMLSMPRINEAFSAINGHAPNDSDLERMYDTFLHINEDVVMNYVVPITGAAKCFSYLRERDIKIGSTTGYGRALMSRVLARAAEEGLIPDTVVCGDELIEARPSPFMMYQNFINLGVYPPKAVIKVDDTLPGIAEGISAGTLTVGLTLSGNATGLTEDELRACATDKIEQMHKKHSEMFLKAGADYVLRSVDELPQLMDKLNEGKP